MTQSPPDKELERSERAASMPDEVILHKIQIPEIGSMLTFVEPLKPDAEFLSADYINKATLADDLARVESAVLSLVEHGQTLKQEHIDEWHDEILTIIRRLRGNQ